MILVSHFTPQRQRFISKYGINNGKTTFTKCINLLSYIKSDIIQRFGEKVFNFKILIVIESKRRKRENILKKYPDAVIADVTNQATDGLVRLSLFYPHGELNCWDI